VRASVDWLSDWQPPLTAFDLSLVDFCLLAHLERAHVEAVDGEVGPLCVVVRVVHRTEHSLSRHTPAVNLLHDSVIIRGVFRKRRTIPQHLALPLFLLGSTNRFLWRRRACGVE
jgi:hypothetical protein